MLHEFGMPTVRDSTPATYAWVDAHLVIYDGLSSWLSGEEAVYYRCSLHQILLSVAPHRALSVP